MGDVDHSLPALTNENENKIKNNNINKFNIKENKKIYIATLNCLSLRTPEKLAELEIAISKINWDIIGLSEVRRTGEYIEDRKEYILYYKGETKGSYGVGFIVKKYLRKNIEEFKGISERIAVLNMNLPGYKDKWSIIQIYAPTEQQEEYIKDLFYNQLSSVLQDTYKNVIVMGDFNGRIGSQRTGEDKVIGNFGFGRRSKNGERMINMALENNLAYMNSFFRKKSNKKWTWISPDGLTRNEIDYIATNSKKSFQDVSIINQFNFNTNHRMVRAVINVIEPKKSRNKFKVKTNLIRGKLVNKIKNKLEEKYEKEINEIYGPLFIKPLKNKRNYIGKETLNLIEERRQLLKLKKAKDNFKAISVLSKQISNNIKKDRTKRRTEILTYHIKKTGGVKKALKELVETKNWIPNIKNQRGKKETGRKAIIHIATEFYRKLYSPEDNSSHLTTNLEDDEKEHIPGFLVSEIEQAIMSQKKEKAPGPDFITNEMIKTSAIVPENLKKLTDLYNTILNTEYIPSQWTKNVIILLHKKGDRNIIENYRPISLMSNMYKIFSKMILNRITKIMDEQQPIEQAGFRAGFSTVDHMHVIKQLIEKCQEYGKALYIAFVDYRKAFDSINHDSLWQALIQQGVPKKYVRIIKNIYENSTAQIKLESTGEEFPIARGVRQGDPLSPKLFSAILENIFRNLDWDSFGININGRQLNHLRFADDLVLISDNAKTLQTMLQQLTEASKMVGLTINKTKTKIMTNRDEIAIKIDSENIEYVKDYIYLGQIISFKDQTDSEIDKRVSCAWKRYWSLKDIFKSKNFPMAAKKKVFDSCVLPCLTYGCQTWALTQKHYTKLRTCQRGMERSMIGVTLKDRTRAQEIRLITKVEDIIKKIRQLKWRWTGHMTRDSKIKWTKIVSEWYPRDGKRKRGRQVKRWTDDIKKIGGTIWPRKANDRMLWKQLEEAYVSHDTLTTNNGTPDV